MEHTGEPWVADGQRFLAQPEGEFGETEVGICFNDTGTGPIVGHQISEEEAEENAQRIADCVTACRGLNPKKVPEVLRILDTIANEMQSANSSGDPVSARWFERRIKLARHALDHVRMTPRAG